MRLLNKDICITSRKSILVIVVILLSTFVLANVWQGETNPIKSVELEEKEMWIPTAEDIAYQDSMYTIIESTQSDIEDIKEDIVFILERLDYEDGTYDSIRYVKGGKIDLRRN
jgi:signal transduction histidine kinase